VAAVALTGCSLLVSLDNLSGAHPGDGGPDGMTPCRPEMVNKDPENCGMCGHSCRGGACTSGQCQPIIVADGQDGPFGIFVNADYVYWVNRARPALRRAFKDGAGPRSLETIGDLNQPFDLVADDVNVYWSDAKDSVVYQKPLAGGGKTPFRPAAGGEARFVALDGGVLYLSAVQTAGPTGVIQNENALYTGKFLVDGLAVHANVIFWIQTMTDMQTMTDTQQIVSGKPTGGASGTPLVGTGTGPSGLAADDRFVYWTEQGRRLLRAALDGGGPTTLFEAAQPFGEADVDVDDKFVYWTGSAGKLVRRLAK
jgi:hypothetical protein